MSHIPRALLLVVVALVLTACGPVGNDDRITAYDTEALVHPDGTVDFTETVTYDFGDAPSPGLFREIPLSESAGFLRHRTWEISGLEVTSPSGAPAGIEDQREWRRVLSMDIGDEDAPVTGEQTYEISYTVHGALTDGEFGPELYWDFVGGEWGVPVDDVTASVEAPWVVDTECYFEERVRDEDGDTESEDVACEESSHDDTAAEFRQGSLDRGAPLSAIVYLEAGTVEPPDTSHAVAPLPRWITLAGVLGLAAALTATYFLTSYVRAWKKKRRARIRKGFTKGLPDLPPAVAGFLFHKKKLRAEHTLALMVSLEEKGHLTSEPSGNGGNKDWIFVRHNSNVALTPSERALAAGMFGLNSEINLKWMGRFMTRGRVRRVERALYREAAQHGLAVKPWIWHPIMVLCAAFLIFALIVGVGFHEVTGLRLAGLEVVSVMMLPVAAGILLVPEQRTPYGDHVRAQLSRKRKKPDGLDPLLGIALGLPDDTVATLNERVPNLRPYCRDHGFRTRWNSTVNRRIRRSRARSGGSSGGGRVSGRGGGGGGGGRRR